MLLIPVGDSGAQEELAWAVAVVAAPRRLVLPLLGLLVFYCTVDTVGTNSAVQRFGSRKWAADDRQQNLPS